MDPDWDEASPIPPPAHSRRHLDDVVVRDVAEMCPANTTCSALAVKLQFRLRELPHPVDADSRTETRHSTGMESFANRP